MLSAPQLNNIKGAAIKLNDAAKEMSPAGEIGNPVGASGKTWRAASDARAPCCWLLLM